MAVEPPYKCEIEPQVESVPFDGAAFHTLLWKAPENVDYKGRIVVVHGFSEDSKVYLEFGDRLAQRGFDVFYFDQRGAGETSKPKDHGKTNEHHVFQDLDFIIKKNLEDKRLPDEKISLIGHSMGGGIVLNYGIKGKYKDSIRAIIASAPLVRLHPSTEPNAILKAASAISYRVMPNFRLDAGLKFDYITRNQKWLDFIKANKSKFWITGALHHDMMARGEMLTRPEFVKKFNPDIKLLVMHSTNDRINSYDASKLFIGLVNDNVDKEFLGLEGAKHSLLIETDDIVDLILDKVEAILSK